MTTLIGYARCSTDKQTLAGQNPALFKLGQAAERIYTDHSLTMNSLLKEHHVSNANNCCLYLVYYLSTTLIGAPSSFWARRKLAIWVKSVALALRVGHAS